MDYDRLNASVRAIRMPDDMRDRVLRRALTTPGQRGRMAVRRGAAVALAAALALCLAGFAYALATSGWFLAYFSHLSGTPLTYEQRRFMEEKSVGIGQSVTADGYTVTVDSAICDAQILYLVIRVEAPEGVDLEPAEEEGGIFFHSVKSESTGDAPRTGHLISWGRTWFPMDDGDGRQNTATLLLREQYVMSEDSSRVYTDGQIWSVQLGELTFRAGAPSYEKTVLAEGGWSFQFPLTQRNEAVELISEPVVCVAQAGGETGPKESVEIAVTSLVLRPFGVTCRYSFLPGVRPEAVDILDLYLVMKDGTTVAAQPRSGGGAGGIGSTGGTMTYLFDAPVMPDQAACLVLPEDVSVPVPEDWREGG